MIVIRPATLDDLAVLHALADRAVTDLLTGIYTDDQLAALRRFRGHEVEPALLEAGRYYVAEVDGLLIAGSGWSPDGKFSHVAGAAQAAPGTATMRATYVRPHWSRRGFASLLAHTTETAARIAGFTTFEALCTPPSRALRLTLGYQVIGPRTLPLGNTQTMTGTLLRKTLPTSGRIEPPSS